MLFPHFSNTGGIFNLKLILQIFETEKPLKKINSFAYFKLMRNAIKI